MGSPIIKVFSGGGSELWITHSPLGNHVTLTVNIPGEKALGVSVPSAQLAARLSEVPGFEARYTPPVVVPSYLGAVVERIEESRGSHHYAARWTRYAKDGDTSLPWVSHHGRTVSNDDVAAVLANGGYERQPEFPRNGETE